MILTNLPEISSRQEEHFYLIKTVVLPGVLTVYWWYKWPVRRKIHFSQPEEDFYWLKCRIFHNCSIHCRTWLAGERRAGGSGVMPGLAILTCEGQLLDIKPITDISDWSVSTGSLVAGSLTMHSNGLSIIANYHLSNPLNCQKLHWYIDYIISLTRQPHFCLVYLWNNISILIFQSFGASFDN